jgi:2-dehydropantoate 2-reductase
LFFGLNNVIDSRLNSLQEILVQSGIKSELSNDINKVTWEKFIFLSSIATATTFFDSNVHEILESNQKLSALKSLIVEVTELARSKEIQVEKQQIERVLDILASLPVEATTSMHSDFKNKNAQTELESLTGFVVEEGRLNNIPIETFEKMYNEIKKVPNKVYSA